MERKNDFDDGDNERQNENENKLNKRNDTKHFSYRITAHRASDERSYFQKCGLSYY